MGEKQVGVITKGHNKNTCGKGPVLYLDCGGRHKDLPTIE